MLLRAAAAPSDEGKVMCRVIRVAYLGEESGDVSALENPQAVEEFKNLG